MDSQFYSHRFPTWQPTLIPMTLPPVCVAQGVPAIETDIGPVRIGHDGCIWRWRRGVGQVVMAPGGEQAEAWLRKHAVCKAAARGASREQRPAVKFAKVYEFRAGGAAGKGRTVRV